MDFKQLNEDVLYEYHKLMPINEMADVGYAVEVHNDNDNNTDADQLKFAHFHWQGVHFKFSKNLPKNATQLKQMIAFKRELNKLDDHELSKLVKILKSKPPINKFGKYNNVYEKALDYWMTFNEREIDYID